MSKAASLVALAFLTAPAAASSEPTLVSLEPVEINATRIRDEMMDRKRVRHPEEAYPAWLIEVLKSATSAEPFLYYGNMERENRRQPESPIGPGVRWGHCISGPALDDLVSSLLDPREYRYGQFGCSYRHEDRWIPGLGITFHSDRGSVALRSERSFSSFTFFEPHYVWPGGRLRPEILSAIAHESFGYVDWSERGGDRWRAQEYWQGRVAN